MSRMDVNFTINDKPFAINAESVPVDTSLNAFIRNNAQLPGTKFMCLEGGCGACIVTVRTVDPFTKSKKTVAVNSCLLPIYACHDLDIVTVEGVGSQANGYHEVQKKLAHFNGSQCGYCSPGMVMNMHSLLEAKNGQVTMEEVENSFGGNICRCTGYRPILDAFKSLAVDADQTLLDMCQDIEDLPAKCNTRDGECKRECTSAVVTAARKKKDKKWYEYCNVAGVCGQLANVLLHGDDDDAGPPREKIQVVFLDKRKWFKVFSVPDIFVVLRVDGNSRYMLVHGNTAHGVYRRPQDIDVFIDVSSVPELHSYSIGSVLELGGNVTLTAAMDILTLAADQSATFEYCRQLVKHIDLVANVPVRNTGSLAGNLSIKHAHNEFPSDIFLLLETVGAKLTLDSGSSTQDVSLTEYLRTDMTKKVITKITLPALDSASIQFMTYKIMPRAQNAHAYVNAGFLLGLSEDKQQIQSARICFGGINPTFVHAKQTEKLLIGKNLSQDTVLQNALQSLSNEINPDAVLPDASPEYRKKLALSLFYKFVLAMNESAANDVYKSGGSVLVRPLSSGKQKFDTDKKKFPLTQNIPKVEGLMQCAGEAQFVNDIPHPPNMLWGALVLATEPRASILNIDATQALQMEGVVAFYSAKDIPGKNNFMNNKIMWATEVEEFFCSDKVLYHGQPVGIILADTFDLAYLAASLVTIKYSVKDRQVLPSMRDVLEREQDILRIEDPKPSAASADSTTAQGEQLTAKTAGHFELGLQYHFTMETQTCLCVPSDEGMDVFSATQWMDNVQSAIAESLKMPQKNINVYVKRLGGGYGSKISRASMIACACALASYRSGRPVRLVLTIEANMHAIGKRYACTNNYVVETNNNGLILALKNRFAEDFGCSLNEPIIDLLTLLSFPNCYLSLGWDNSGKAIRTDSAKQTFCRSPGTAEGIAMIETIMDNIAQTTGKDPVAVRLANMSSVNPLKNLIPSFMSSTDFAKRKKNVDAFNAANRWKKRGIALTPMEFIIGYTGLFNVTVSIYHTDGTVAISHGGIEMGQGMNTKAVQVAAYTLGIPVAMISVKRSCSITAPNNTVTGASFGSEAIAYAVKNACDILMSRLAPQRKGNDKWQDLVQRCYEANIDLCGNYTYHKEELLPYFVYGVSIAELEIDVLTGQLQILRVDILEDTGASMSPGIDVGQIEGAFTMGLGYFLTEKLIYDRETGKLLTDRTWNYKPPGAKDIPIDFRITLLQNTSNMSFVLRSKATGEPAFCMAVVVLSALRYALDAARKDANVTEKWYELGAPTTVEDVFLAAGNNIKDYKLTK